MRRLKYCNRTIDISFKLHLGGNTTEKIVESGNEDELSVIIAVPLIENEGIKNGM